MTSRNRRTRSLRSLVVGLVVVTMAVSLVAVNSPPASAAVECNIVTGAPARSQQIARLYKAVFHRAPEPKGWNYWKGVLADSSLFNIADYFVTAPEFTNLYGSATNADFVDLVYLNVMGRTADPKGFGYWLNLLNTGELTRSEMVVYFSESAEFKRRETEVYVEQCPKVLSVRPSVLYSGAYRLQHLPSQTGTRGEYALAFDRRTNATAYALEDPDGDSWLGTRDPGESCVSWRSAEASTIRSVLADTSTDNDTIWWASDAGPFFYDDPTSALDRVGDFQTAVGAAYGFEVDGCEQDTPTLSRMSQRDYQLMFEHQADDVIVYDGFVRRVFDLDTAEIRRIAASGDPGLTDLIGGLTQDLAAVDASGGAGGVHLELTVWEDMTGNLLVARAVYDLYFIVEGDAWSWDEQIAVMRVPTS